jgi:hypothetical protein
VRRLLLVLTAAVLAPATSFADDGLPLELTWSAPPDCADADALRAELGRIARVRPGRTVARLSATGRIVHAGTEYRLSLHTSQEGVEGERTLVATECRSLEREVTLVLALAFGEGVELVDAPSSQAAPANASPQASSAGASPVPFADASQAASAPQPASPGASSPSQRYADPAYARSVYPKSEYRAAPPSSQRAEGGGRARVAGFAGGGVLFGALPAPAGYVVAGAQLGLPRLWLEPRFVWIPGVAQSLERSVHAEYSGFGGGLSACGAPFTATAPAFARAFDACAGVDTLALRGQSSGASESDEAVAPLVSGVVSADWHWPARGLVALRLDAALHVAFNEPHFVVEGLGDAHHVPRVSPSLGATILFGGVR